MIIEKKTSPIKWGEIDLALFGIDNNWQGRAITPPCGFGMAIDDTSFWFVATRNKAATSHPDSIAGEFTPKLWQYDVAELFIHDPATSRYLELNLAPNSAWWCALFSAERTPAQIPHTDHTSSAATSTPINGVRTYSDLAPDGTWVAAISIPLDELAAIINFSDTSEMNVTFITDSPQQQFLTANPPEGIEPDFHQYKLFKPAQFLENGITFHQQQAPTS